MTTAFDSFNKSPLGGFIESPLGARGEIGGNIYFMGPQYDPAYGERRLAVTRTNNFLGNLRFLVSEELPEGYLNWIVSENGIYIVNNELTHYYLWGKHVTEGLKTYLLSTEDGWKTHSWITLENFRSQLMGGTPDPFWLVYGEHYGTLREIDSALTPTDSYTPPGPEAYMLQIINLSNGKIVILHWTAVFDGYWNYTFWIAEKEKDDVSWTEHLIDVTLALVYSRPTIQEVDGRVHFWHNFRTYTQPDVNTKFFRHFSSAIDDLVTWTDHGEYEKHRTEPYMIHWVRPGFVTKDNEVICQLIDDDDHFAIGKTTNLHTFRVVQQEYGTHTAFGPAWFVMRDENDRLWWTPTRGESPNGYWYSDDEGDTWTFQEQTGDLYYKVLGIDVSVTDIVKSNY